MKKNLLWYLLAVMIIIQIFPLGVTAEVTNPQPSTLEGLSYAEVNVSGTLNMRKASNASSPILTRIPDKEVVLVYSSEEEWSYITYEGFDGYVMSRYLNAFESLPFSTLAEGDSSKEVLRLKERLQQLGYFRSGADSMSSQYTSTLKERIKILQKANGLKADGILSPELQAFIYWGPVKRNVEILPPAPYYVSAKSSSPILLLVGPQGEAGPTGPQGPKGDTGATGSQGLTGPQGLDGKDGIDGEDGASIVSAAFVGDDLVFTLDDGSIVALTGAKIDLKGDAGPQGPAGPQGEVGPAGPQGEAGVVPPHSHIYNYYGTPISIGQGQLTLRPSMTDPYPYDEAETPLSASITNFSVDAVTATVSFTYNISGGVAPYQKDYYVNSPDWSNSFIYSISGISNTLSDSVSLTSSYYSASYLAGKDFTLTLLVTDSLGTEVSVQKSGTF